MAQPQSNLADDPIYVSWNFARGFTMSANASKTRFTVRHNLRKVAVFDSWEAGQAFIKASIELGVDDE